METQPKIRFSKNWQALTLRIINRKFVSEASYVKACLATCRTLGLELKSPNGDKRLARLLAGTWRPRPSKGAETQTDAYLREREEEIARLLLNQFDPAAKAVSDRVRLWLRFLGECSTAPLKECQKVLGPRFWRCRSCGKAFFASTRRGDRAYCSRKCGSSATATKRVGEVRAGQHAAKLERATRALKKIKAGPDLKLRLAAKIGESPKWITRQLNSGSLKVPARLKHDLAVSAPRVRQAVAAKTDPGFSLNALPTKAARVGKHTVTTHLDPGTVQGDRDAIRRFNHLIRGLTFDPSLRPTRVRFQGTVVAKDE